MTIGSRPYDAGPFGTGATTGSGAGGSGVELQAWTQLTATTEGSAPTDATPLGDTGTSFSAGLFRVVATNTTTQIDGSRENILRWTYPLSSLTGFDDFDPGVYNLEIAADFRAAGGGQFPLGANDGLGVFVGVADRSVADIANLNAVMGGMQRAGVANYGARHVFASSVSGGSLSGTDPDVAITEISWAVTGTGTWRAMQNLRFRIPATSGYVTDTTATAQPALSATLANWVITTGAFHASTTAATGVDVRWRVFYRLVPKHATLLPT